MATSMKISSNICTVSCIHINNCNMNRMDIKFQVWMQLTLQMLLSKIIL